jgi:hypothetical protein
MQDDTEPSRTLLYQMSKNNALTHFRKLVLVSSYQDRYVPRESSALALQDGPRKGLQVY